LSFFIILPLPAEMHYESPHGHYAPDKSRD
jgi:hypothetical protein